MRLPKGTSVRQTAPFKPLGIEIGRPVRSMRVLNESKSEMKKKTQKAVTSPYWGDETLGVIAINFGMRNLGMIINRAVPGFDRSIGFHSADP
jgi:hypothetical protein